MKCNADICKQKQQYAKVFFVYVKALKSKNTIEEKKYTKEHDSKLMYALVSTSILIN